MMHFAGRIEQALDAAVKCWVEVAEDLC